MLGLYCTYDKQSAKVIISIFRDLFDVGTIGLMNKVIKILFPSETVARICSFHLGQKKPNNCKSVVI